MIHALTTILMTFHLITQALRIAPSEDPAQVLLSENVYDVKLTFIYALQQTTTRYAMHPIAVEFYDTQVSGRLKHGCHSFQFKNNFQLCNV